MTHHTPEPFGSGHDGPPHPQYNQPQYQQPPFVQPQYQQPQYAQPQYAQPPQGPTGPRPGTEKNWLNITALVLTLAGFLTGITALPGVILGHMGLRAAKRGEADNRGLGIAAVIIGYIILVFVTIVIVGLVWLYGWLWNECGGDDPANWCTTSTTTYEFEN